MRVAVFYGNNRRGTTWKLTQIFLSALAAQEVTEFFLPRDMDAPCTGCMRCIAGEEALCPHAGRMAPLRAAMERADLIVLASPVYVMGPSGAMKSFLDHLAWTWMVHRPQGAMFSKVGVVISTAAGPCTGKVKRALKEQFYYWGAARTYAWGEAVGGGWDYLAPRRRAALERRAARLAGKCARAAGRAKPGPATRAFFAFMVHMQRRGWSGQERDYWAAQGWMDGARPWRQGGSNHGKEKSDQAARTD